MVDTWKKIGHWCKHRLTEVPKRIARFGKAVWNTAKKVPKAVWKAAKKAPEVIWETIKKVSEAVRDLGMALWSLLTVRIPNAIHIALKWTWEAISSLAWAIVDVYLRIVSLLHTVLEAVVTFLRNVVANMTPELIWKAIKMVWKAFRDLGKALWTLFTLRIPKAIRITLKWTWEAISSLARAIGDVFLEIASSLHTLLEVTVTFMRNVTLSDIWNVFCNILRAVFVTLPRTLWSWIQDLGEASYRFTKALLHCFCNVLWWIGICLRYVVVYLSTRCWIILRSVGGSFAKAFSEISVWINPKA